MATQMIRANNDFTVFSSAARTATANSDDFVLSGDPRHVILILDITAASGTSPTLDVKVQMKDSTSGNYVDIPGAAFAQKTNTGTDSLAVGPGVTEQANRQESHPIPLIMRVVATIGGTTPSFTFSIGGQLLG